MQTLVLPRLAGTREAVADLVAEQKLPGDLRGTDVIVVGADLLAGSSSFADELVKETLVQRHADHLVLVGVSGVFDERLRAAAERRGVQGKLRHKSAVEAGV